MKNVKKVIAISTVCIIGICTHSLAATKGFVKSETVRLRQKATTDSPIVALMSLDEEVQILSEENGWYKVQYKDKTGYASKEYVGTQIVQQNETVQQNSININQNSTDNQNNIDQNNIENQTNITENNVEISIENELNTNQDSTQDDIIKEELKGEMASDIKLKIVPAINSSDILTLQQGRELTVKEIINDWCYIEATIGSGWVRKQILSKNIKLVDEIKNEENNKQVTEEGQKEEGQPKIENQENKEEKNNQQENKKEDTITKKIGYVNVNSVNVRSKTDTTSKILTSLQKNTEVQILGEENNWYKVKVNNITGYIATKYLSNQKVAETTSRSLENERIPSETTNSGDSTNDDTTNKEISNSQTTSEVKTNSETTSKASSTQSTTSANSSTGAEIVEYAKKYLGSKYVSGGASPSTGFDCSGFTCYVYKNFGKTLSRTSKAQASNGKAVSKSELQLGDIVVFNNNSNTAVGHVGIYVGGNTFIHAANSRKGVITTSLSDSYYSKRYVGARRII